MQADEFNALVHASQFTPLQAQRLAVAFGLDPSSAFTVPCAGPGCSAEMTLAQSHSYVVVYATTGASGVPSFQCEQEQHYGCSPACAMAAAQRCMAEHLTPRVSSGT